MLSGAVLCGAFYGAAILFLPNVRAANRPGPVIETFQSALSGMTEYAETIYGAGAIAPPPPWGGSRSD